MKWLRPIGAIILAGGLVSVATAGDYHRGLQLRCAECHNMHFSQSHGYNPDGTFGSFIPPLGGGGPFENLLRDEVNNLCLACHDDSTQAPDVLGNNGGKYPGDIRLGGYLNRLGVEGLAPTGHTLDDTTQAPGGTWTPDAEGLKCTDCHQQHGYAGPNFDPQGNYRNLKYDPGDQYSFGNPALVTYEIGGTPTNAKDVYEFSARAYDEADAQWQEPVQTDSAIARWCGGCHENFHGLADGTDPDIGGKDDNGDGLFDHFVRHPVGGVDIGAIGGGHSSLSQYNARVNKVKVMSATGVWDPAPATATVTCISCHKAHGNGNAFGLIFRSDDGPISEDGDTSGNGIYEDLCGQCHVQASAFN